MLAMVTPAARKVYRQLGREQGEAILDVAEKLAREAGLDKVFEAVGRLRSGNIDEQELHQLECDACPGAGSCSGMFTANTMGNLAEES